MDRSSDYRLKVEDQQLTNFYSDKTKTADFFSTLRNAAIPNSLRNSLIKKKSPIAETKDTLQS